MTMKGRRVHAPIAVNANGRKPPAGLIRVFFADDSGKERQANAEWIMRPGETRNIALKGVLLNGNKVDLSDVERTIVSCGPALEVEANGAFRAIRRGASFIYASVNGDAGELRTPDAWVRIEGSERAELAKTPFDFRLSHPHLAVRIGEPAMLEPGETYPVVAVHSGLPGAIRMNVWLDGIRQDALACEGAAAPGLALRLAPPGRATRQGRYEYRIEAQPPGGSKTFDVFEFTVRHAADLPAGESRILFAGPDGRLAYAGDYKGNKPLDFSNAGYRGGEADIPEAVVREIVEPCEGDSTERIQAAIDRMAMLPAGKDGLRGAVLLKRGTFEVAGTLRIRSGGIVLRGEGDGEDGTTIRGTGRERRDLIVIGEGLSIEPIADSASEIADLYVPSGARAFHVEDARGFKPGDRVIVRRSGNDDWIHEIGMDYIYNRPNGGVTQWCKFDLDFDREIVAVEGNRLTVDAPIACAIERTWGGGRVFRYRDHRLEEVGIEHMRAVSDFDPAVKDTVMDNESIAEYRADENHAERFAVFDGVRNGWLRNVTGYHFVHALAQLGRASKWITVQDCGSFDMIGIITGGRRYAYHLMGQLGLVQRSVAETARHAFVVDSFAEGPNVFFACSSVDDYNTSEPHHRWSVGGLYDNVSAPISIRDRAWLGSGHGWAGANYVSWNTEGALTVQKPPTAQNYSFGHVGKFVPGLVPSYYDPRPRSQGYREGAGRRMKPESLYRRQLEERLSGMIQSEGKKEFDDGHSL